MGEEYLSPHALPTAWYLSVHSAGEGEGLTDDEGERLIDELGDTEEEADKDALNDSEREGEAEGVAD